MKYIDLSHTLSEETPIYPGDFQLSLKQEKTIESDYYNSYVLKSALHTGTHIDAPMHLVEDDRFICDFEVDSFVGRGFLIEAVGESEIDYKEEYESQIKKGDIVLIHTGYDKLFKENTKKYYSEHPSITKKLSDFLISREVKAVGVDMEAPDNLPYVLHKDILRANVFVIENLTNLDKLKAADSFEVIALPLKLKAEASLTRVVARILD